MCVNNEQSLTINCHYTGCLTAILPLKINTPRGCFRRTIFGFPNALFFKM